MGRILTEDAVGQPSGGRASRHAVTLLDALRAAFRGLERHWVRAVLNMIGIMAGVASVVLLISVSHAVGSAANSQVEGLGADLVVVYSSGVSSSGVQIGLGSTSTLTINDANALANPGYVPDAVQAVPTAALRDNITASSRTWQTDVLGSTTGFPAAVGYTMSEGRFFTSAENKTAASVVVLGQTAAHSLFVNLNPIGQLVRINEHPFTVIGVFGQRGYSGTYNQDDIAVTPITAEWAYVLPASSPRIQQIIVQATSPQTTPTVKDEVTNTLLLQHNITNPSLADFQVQTQQDLLAASQRVSTVMSWMLGAIAVIALLTGGIAIMSLMLSSVRERVFEIGIRRAVGADRGDILAQFMAEALLITCIGLVAGVAVGFGAATLIANFVPDVAAPVVTWTAVLIAVASALFVGIVAGLYPAMRAASLEPIEAVRRV
jgi:putative ABC transport system permease protein